MPIDQRDAWVRAYLEDVFNGHNLQSLDKYMTENIVSHWLSDRSLYRRKPGERRWPTQLLRRLWEGIPATGRKAKWTVIIIGRFEGEKLAKDWVEYDRYNLFR